MQGHEGWDEYAPFYDWENAQTVGRRDIPFWIRLARQTIGARRSSRRVLELGCGTGRISFPLAREPLTVVGIDRSAAMLQRAVARRRRQRRPRALSLLRGDIRQLPFAERSFPLVIAPYGILQSLLQERDLVDTLAAVHRVLQRRGTFGLELVPDLPTWKEYSNRVTMRGRRPDGAHITLTESVRQDRKRHLTSFDQHYAERRGRTVTRRRFTLTFRTLTVTQMAARLEEAGFEVTALLGDYRGRPWDLRSEAWILLARKL